MLVICPTCKSGNPRVCTLNPHEPHRHGIVHDCCPHPFHELWPEPPKPKARTVPRKKGKPAKEKEPVAA